MQRDEGYSSSNVLEDQPWPCDEPVVSLLPVMGMGMMIVGSQHTAHEVMLLRAWHLYADGSSTAHQQHHQYDQHMSGEKLISL